MIQSHSTLLARACAFFTALTLTNVKSVTGEPHLFEDIHVDEQS
jgi:hypothetical protein